MDTLFSDYIRGEKMLFKHARGTSDRSGKEFHIYHELILFLGGEGEFISEQLHTYLKPKTLILIPKETYHQFLIHGEKETYYRCVLQFDDIDDFSILFGEFPRDILSVEADGEMEYLFHKLVEATEKEEWHARLILKSVLALLLETMLPKMDVPKTERPQNPAIQAAIAYINQHLSGRLLVQEIAQACNLSVSSLSHIFKKEMHCSVHRFIVNKRLIGAYHRISGGEAATSAAAACGFQDYSGFYKQYKKAFGFPPSQKHLREL